MTYNRERAADLTMALMYLSIHDGTRVWKGYDWDVLNFLHERGLISNPRSKTKSVVLTEEGEARSKEMFAKYLAVAA
jgi:hypothetical protein